MNPNAYSVVGAPNYNQGVMDWSKFFGSGGNSNGQGQGSNNTSLIAALQQFLNQNGQAQTPGSAVSGAFGPSSVGGPNGPTPLQPSNGMFAGTDVGQASSPFFGPVAPGSY